MATEELAVLAVISFAAISQVLAQYSQSNKGEDAMLLVNVPEAGESTQSITVTGKSDKEVVAEVTQVVTVAIDMGHNLSRVDQNRLDNQLRLQKLGFIKTI